MWLQACLKGGAGTGGNFYKLSLAIISIIFLIKEGAISMKVY
jgi:hypothetical protein